MSAGRASGAWPAEPLGAAMARGGNGATVLRVDGLVKQYRSRRDGTSALANDRVSLTVREGEVVALLGPNGAGKSTLLRQIAGQLLPTAGTIEVAGVDMIDSPGRAKRLVSVIPQECHPVNELTVEEHVRYFGLIKDTPRARVAQETERILERVGLTEHRSKTIRELSGGLKRRVLIAVALAGAGARLLLLDEPTTGLDPEARRSVWKVVEGLREQGRGVLLTTHYIEEAEYLADRVIIIDRGRIVASGTVDEIRFRLPFRGRLEVRNRDRLGPDALAEVEALGRRWRTGTDTEGRVRWEVPDPFAPETVEALARLTARGAVATLSPVTLEDAYLALVAPEGAAA